MNLLFTSLEPGMQPGPGLSAIETFLYFVVAPIGLFTIISLLSYASTAKSTKRNRSKSVVDQID